MVRTVLSNAEHPEYGSIPLEFPIPDEQYDHTVAQLEKLGIGTVQNSDCKIDTLNSWYTVLEPLTGHSWKRSVSARFKIRTAKSIL